MGKMFEPFWPHVKCIMMAQYDNSVTPSPLSCVDEDSEIRFSLQMSKRLLLFAGSDLESQAGDIANFAIGSTVPAGPRCRRIDST